MNCKNKQAIFASKLDLSQFQYIKSINDNRMGSIEIFQHKQIPEVYIMAKKKVLKSQEKFIKELQKTQQRTELNHNNIIQIDKNQFEIKGFYEFPKWDLEREIQHRKSQNDYFSNQDLKRLMIDLINALVFLQNNNLIHGDLRPKYITYSPNIKLPIRLMDRLADSFTPEQLQIKNLRKQNSLYLSPIVFKTIVNRDKYLKHDPYKSEMFSLGLIILQTGLLKSIQSIYDQNQKEINFENLSNLIKQFLNQYGDDKLLSHSIIKLLDLQEKQRMDPLEFQQYLQNNNQIKFLSSSSKQEKSSNLNQMDQNDSYKESEIEIQKFEEGENYNQQSIKNNIQDHLEEEIPLYESNEEFDIENNELIKNETDKYIEKYEQDIQYSNLNKEQIVNDIDQEQQPTDQIPKDVKKQKKLKENISQNIISAFSKELENSNSLKQNDYNFNKKQQQEQVNIDNFNKQQIDQDEIQDNFLYHKSKQRKLSIFDQPEGEYFSCRTIKNDSNEKIYIRKRKIKSKFITKRSVSRKTPPFNGHQYKQQTKINNLLQRQYYHSPTKIKSQQEKQYTLKELSRITYINRE